MKKKLNKITVAALGVIMLSGVCATNANAAPMPPRHGQNKPAVVVKKSSNTGAVITAGAIGTIAGLAIGVAASNNHHYPAPQRVHYVQHPRYKHSCGSYKCTKSRHSHYNYNQRWVISSPCR
ncbi:MAG: hypothetical protein FWF23_01535 [Alphaproteobacteria bacterium]|nr:hypothetical protein [Alphaproteobacteria bacterium]MCL2505058.1 hypothetical protein [Alphaproteobacteria bacterium]